MKTKEEVQDKLNKIKQDYHSYVSIHNMGMEDKDYRKHAPSLECDNTVQCYIKQIYLLEWVLQGNNNEHI